mmetsp:Transcript_109452/g.308837  ORF Transcript_109452/g.308837 Transcript_109452/m.308837 type:complete len:222 (+) Transcript_109452:314-979(+)
MAEPWLANANVWTSRRLWPRPDPKPSRKPLPPERRMWTSRQPFVKLRCSAQSLPPTGPRMHRPRTQSGGNDTRRRQGRATWSCGRRVWRPVSWRVAAATGSWRTSSRHAACLASHKCTRTPRLEALGGATRDLVLAQLALRALTSMSATEEGRHVWTATEDRPRLGRPAAQPGQLHMAPPSRPALPPSMTGSSLERATRAPQPMTTSCAVVVAGPHRLVSH